MRLVVDLEHTDEASVGGEGPVRHQPVQMRVEVDELAKRLDCDDAPEHEVVSVEQRAIDFTDRLPCEVRQTVKQVSVEAKEDPQSLGDGPHEMAMRHGVARILGGVDGDQDGPFLIARSTLV